MTANVESGLTDCAWFWTEMLRHTYGLLQANWTDCLQFIAATAFVCDSVNCDQFQISHAEANMAIIMI